MNNPGTLKGQRRKVFAELTTPSCSRGGCAIKTIVPFL
jgi:hypothetical protein